MKIVGGVRFYDERFNFYLMGFDQTVVGLRVRHHVADFVGFDSVFVFIIIIIFIFSRDWFLGFWCLGCYF